MVHEDTDIRQMIVDGLEASGVAYTLTDAGPEPELPVIDYANLSDRETIITTFEIFCSQVVEVRFLNVDGRKTRTDAGYFDREHFPEAADKILQHFRSVGKCAGAYFTLNPPTPALLARYQNRIEKFAELTTSDKDIEKRRWILIDCDPVRPSGISSSQSEFDSSLQTANDIVDSLLSHGLPEPIVAISGNGAHIQLPVDLPNDEAATELVKKFLEVLDAGHSNEIVHVDRAVFNAARVGRVYGTFAGKGDSTEDRPHRRARLLKVPDYLQYGWSPSEAATAPQIQRVIERLTKELPPEQSTKVSVSVPANLPAASSTRDLPGFLRDHGVQYSEGKPDSKFAVKLHVDCPFDSNHTGKDAFCYVNHKGQWGFTCSHNSCKGQRTWQEFKRAIGWQPSDKQHDQGHPEASRPPSEQPKRSFAGIDAAELSLWADQDAEWLVDEIFTTDEPLLVGARSKGCKTLQLTDLAVAVASGTQWMKCFDVPKRRKVLFITGEANNRRIAKHIQKACASRGIQFDDLRGYLRIEAIEFPCLPNIVDQDAIRADIEQHAIEVVIIDPLYRGMAGVDASRLNEMGAAIKSFQAACSPAMVILSHHVVKSAAREYGEPPSLEDMTGAGIAESCGQWWLVGRNEKYQWDWRHDLCISYGGREGQGGGKRIVFDEQHWTFQAENLHEFREQNQQEREEQKLQAKRQADEAKRHEARQKIMRTLRSVRTPLSRSRIRDDSGLSGTILGPAFTDLISEGFMVQRPYRDGANRIQTEGYILQEYAAEYDQNWNSPEMADDGGR